MKTLPKSIQSNLRYQTNSLNTKNKNDKHVRSLSNFLISKTKKKQNDLLLHPTEKFRIKTELKIQFLMKLKTELITGVYHSEDQKILKAFKQQ